MSCFDDSYSDSDNFLSSCPLLAPDALAALAFQFISTYIPVCNY